MSFQWRLEPDSHTADVAQDQLVFGNQSDAESWLGETWRELAERGVTNTVLSEDGVVLYEMSLLPG